MTPEEIHAMFMNNKYYIINSTKTGKIYMSEDLRAHIFESASSADSFCREVGNAEKGDRKTINIDSSMKILSGLGFKEILVSNSDEDVIVPVSGSSSLKRNSYLMQNLLLLKETEKIKYLSAASGERFIIPVSLKARISKQFQQFRYGASYIEGDEKCFLLFQDMTAFSLWNEKHDNFFQPLFMTINQLDRIRWNYAFVIDPLGLKIYLGEDEIKIMKGVKS